MNKNTSMLYDIVRMDLCGGFKTYMYNIIFFFLE